MTNYGIDIASYQGSAIDWTATAGNNISFVSVKVTEDTDYTNPYATAQADGARGAGIHAGGYHFARPGDPSAQVDHFVTELTARNLLAAGSLLPMLDVEVGLGDDANTWIGAFRDLFEQRTGVGLLVYASLDWYRNVLVPSRWASPSTRLWVAQWNGDPGHPDYSDPALAIHQHSNRGSVPGFGGLVDRDATVDGVDLSAVLIGGVSAPTQPTPPSAPSDGWVAYTVVAGDTLSAIAERTGTTWQELASRNNIPNPNLIRVGQVIQVPGNGNSGGQMYRIQPGDTLSQLAANWGTTVDAIASLNGIPNPNLIFAGEWIRRP
ncbi:GH25 family lysozyme [Kutzneria buriramensis]|uniref:GH25 family lysozyme M1 (1,4-beta-N-acetylmuramidase) n=1 Tax=Kutzneria buriramensis TaxID=1045776 RepID=A0A3E0HDK4_9PSEU|nr:GH25 family lysozyme [Kutzneria buriramensis]REH42732.1 GH25 family lysozyme M1 (1,4-beta-N-acetylmuramidase) [Kutzneria buriramensis]